MTMEQNKAVLAARFVAAAKQGRSSGPRGAHGTRTQVMAQASRLGEIIWDLGYQMHDATQLREKHARAAFAELRRRELSKGTLQNYARTMRFVMVGAGKTKMAEVLTNEVLQVSGRCRAGTKIAMTAETLSAARVEISKMKDQDKAVRLWLLIELSRRMGLRILEALCCSVHLKQWRKSIAQDGNADLHAGTKGSRPRSIFIQAELRQELLSVIDRAIKLLVRRRGKWVLWTASKKLENSLRTLSQAANKVGIKGEESWHSLRYVFATTQCDAYLAKEVDRASALAFISSDLGHGDSRGRYVQHVYLRKKEKLEP